MKAINDLAEKLKDLAHRKGQELSDTEATEGAHKLVSLFELLIEFQRKDAAKKYRLKKEPGGFPVDGQYSCMLCKTSINPTTGWYDWYGHTCFPCRKAVLDKTIPTYVFKDDNSYFTLWGLEHHFQLKSPTVRKYIREGQLTSRTVLSETGRPYCYIFLKEDNPRLVSRYSATRKSYDRNKAKCSQRYSKQQKITR